MKKFNFTVNVDDEKLAETFQKASLIMGAVAGIATEAAGLAVSAVNEATVAAKPLVENAQVKAFQVFQNLSSKLNK
jgi:hypothetical protein